LYAERRRQRYSIPIPVLPIGTIKALPRLRCCKHAFYAKNWHVLASFELEARCCRAARCGRQTRYNPSFTSPRNLMARPRSEDKRNAIISAALAEFAVRGVWSTPTSAISKAAGVAEGTLFTYFASKEILMNEIYRELKIELAEAIMANFPHAADPRSKFVHLWNKYVHWGAQNPVKMKVMGQLRLSDQITEESRAAGSTPFAALIELMQSSIKDKIIRNYPVDFIGAMFSGLAETTMVYMESSAKDGTDYCAAGFETLWRGLTL
jgi:AcrR family transcriptional regulator